jgi:hypothetical protein
MNASRLIPRPNSSQIMNAKAKLNTDVSMSSKCCLQSGCIHAREDQSSGSKQHLLWLREDFVATILALDKKTHRRCSRQIPEEDCCTYSMSAGLDCE